MTIGWTIRWRNGYINLIALLYCRYDRVCENVTQLNELAKPRNITVLAIYVIHILNYAKLIDM
jgi:hypothetical protein